MGSCGVPTSPSSPHSLRPTAGSSSCAAWLDVGWQECRRGQHAHACMHACTHAHSHVNALELGSVVAASC